MSTKFVLSAISERCSQLVSLERNWKTILFTDEDTDTSGYMYLAGKCTIPTKVVINQPTFRGSLQMFVQEVLTLSKLTHVTEVVVQATRSASVGYLMQMKQLVSLKVAHAPNLGFGTLFACTRLLPHLKNYHLQWYHGACGSNVLKLVEARKDLIQILEVTHRLLPDDVAQVLTQCSALVHLDFVPTPFVCGHDWMMLIQQHGTARFGARAMKEFQNSGFV